jgi:hypothetical protein
MVNLPKWVNLVAAIPSAKSFDTTQGSGTPININGTTGQGYYLANGGAVVPFSGAVINVRAFGAVGDDTTNDGPAFLAALAYLNSIGLSGGTYGYPGRSAPKLFIPAGRYFLGTNTLDILSTIIMEGEGVGSESAQSTVLRWSAGATGIRVQSNTTSGDTTSGLALAYSGDGSIIRNLALIGGAQVDANFYAIHLRARATIQDCFIDKWQGEGIYIIAVAPNNGNANNWRVERTVIQNTRHGMFVDGPDVNAGIAYAVSVDACRGWGIWDSSFLGNTYTACHVAGSTSGAYKSDDVSARNVFIGCYSESGQPASSFVGPTLVLGGLHDAGTGTYGGHLDGQGGNINTKGNLVVDGDLYTLTPGKSRFFGPESGAAADALTYFDNTNIKHQLLFRTWVAGVPTQDAEIYGQTGAGMLLNGTGFVQVRISGVRTFYVDANAIDLDAGKSLRFNGTVVIDSSRNGIFAAVSGPHKKVLKWHLSSARYLRSFMVVRAAAVRPKALSAIGLNTLPNTAKMLSVSSCVESLNS